MRLREYGLLKVSGTLARVRGSSSRQVGIIKLRKCPNKEEKDQRERNYIFKTDTEGDRERERESERFKVESEVGKKFVSGSEKHKE